MGRAGSILRGFLAISLAFGVACSSGNGEDDSNEITLTAELSGDQVAPGPGMENASGHATVTIGAPAGRVCISYSVPFAEAVTAVKIGNGNPNDFGATLVTFPAGAGEPPGGCMEVEPAVTRGIKLLPASYYVEVDTASFPEGAVRGQLSSG